MCETGAPARAAEAEARESSPERAQGRSAGVVCPPRLSDGHTTFVRTAWLGKGGFAAVYAVLEPASGSQYALKVINKATLDHGSRRKLASEVELHTPLRHPRVVRLHKAFEDDGNVYLLLQQWGGGASLAHAVAARGKLPEHEAAAHAAALLDALAHLHAQGVAHRDVKPANCLLRCQAPAAELPPARPSCVGLADLGLAAKCGPAAPARRGLCGTPNYLAPEALAGSHGREADVWALGCLAHTLMVGQPPFAAPTVPATYARIKAGDLRMPTHLSAPAQDFLRAALRMDPKERPSAAELLQHPFVATHAALLPPPHDVVAPPPAPATPLQAGTPVSTRGSPARGSPARGSPARGSPARGSPARLVLASSPSAALRGSPARGRDARSRLGAPPPMQLSGSPATPAPPRAAAEPLPRAARTAHLTPATPFTPASPPSASPASASASPAGGRTVGRTSECWADTLRVVRHVDAAERYGLGFALSDGAVGALFLDGSRMVAAAQSGPLLYVPRRARGASSPASPASVAAPVVLRAASAAEASPELSKKAGVLRYLASQLGAPCSVPDSVVMAADADAAPAPVPAHVVAWARSAHAVAFRLSTRAVQLRFKADSSQLLLSPDGATVWFDRADGSAPVRHALEGLPAAQAHDAPLMRRLRFARTLLLRLAATGSGADGATGDAGDEEGLEL